MSMKAHRRVRRAASIPGRIAARIAALLPMFRFVAETRDTQTPITLATWARQHILGVNAGPYWPVHASSLISGSWRNVLAGIETSPGSMPGCYIQAIGKIFIGDYTQIGPGVGLISSNHDMNDLRIHKPDVIRIGAYCWLGMNAVVLPGVTLGDFTIVGANSVVTKSFPDGYCVIVGNPARVVQQLDPGQCPRHTSRFEYHGYVPKAQFDAFRAQELKL